MMSLDMPGTPLAAPDDPGPQAGRHLKSLGMADRGTGRAGSACSMHMAIRIEIATTILGRFSENENYFGGLIWESSLHESAPGHDLNVVHDEA